MDILIEPYSDTWLEGKQRFDISFGLMDDFVLLIFSYRLILACHFIDP